jgi:hypothetical protein
MRSFKPRRRCACRARRLSLIAGLAAPQAALGRFVRTASANGRPGGRVSHGVKGREIKMKLAWI